MTQEEITEAILNKAQEIVGEIGLEIVPKEHLGANEASLLANTVWMLILTRYNMNMGQVENCRLQLNKAIEKAWEDAEDAIK